MPKLYFPHHAINGAGHVLEVLCPEGIKKKSLVSRAVTTEAEKKITQIQDISFSLIVPDKHRSKSKHRMLATK